MKAITSAATVLAAIALVSASPGRAKAADNVLNATSASNEESNSSDSAKATGVQLKDSALSMVTTVVPLSAPSPTMLADTGASTSDAGVAITGGALVSGSMTTGAGGVGMVPGTTLGGGAIPGGAGGSLLGGGLLGGLMQGH